MYAITASSPDRDVLLVAQESSACIVIDQAHSDFILSEESIRTELAERNLWHTEIIKEQATDKASLPGSGPALGALMSGRCRDRTALARSGSLVKTTTFGELTPFYISRNELVRSETDAEIYRLYRLFGFRDRPRLFELPGAISARCEIEAVSYLALLG